MVDANVVVVVSVVAVPAVLVLMDGFHPIGVVMSCSPFFFRGLGGEMILAAADLSVVTNTESAAGLKILLGDSCIMVFVVPLLAVLLLPPVVGRRGVLVCFGIGVAFCFLDDTLPVDLKAADALVDD